MSKTENTNAAKMRKILEQALFFSTLIPIIVIVIGIALLNAALYLLSFGKLSVTLNPKGE